LLRHEWKLGAVAHGRRVFGDDLSVDGGARLKRRVTGDPVQPAGMSANSSQRDAEIIDLGRRIIEIENAQVALCEQDVWAPDNGPNQERYEA